MKHKKLTLLVLFVLLASALIYLAKSQGLFPSFMSKGKNPSSSGTPQGVCTLDALLCDDGTAVGRVGPNCEFAPCPSSTPKSWKN